MGGAAAVGFFPFLIPPLNFLPIIAVTFYAAVALLLWSYVAKRSHRNRALAFGFLTGIFLRLVFLICCIVVLQADSTHAKLGRYRAAGYFILSPDTYETMVLIPNQAKTFRRLAEEPDAGIDPYTNRPFKRRESGEPYSIGMDFIDDGGMVSYDPTNGFISRGDLWLPYTGSVWWNYPE